MPEYNNISMTDDDYAFLKKHGSLKLFTTILKSVHNIGRPGRPNTGAVVNFVRTSDSTILPTHTVSRQLSFEVREVITEASAFIRILGAIYQKEAGVPQERQRGLNSPYNLLPRTQLLQLLKRSKSLMATFPDKTLRLSEYGYFRRGDIAQRGWEDRQQPEQHLKKSIREKPIL